MDLKRFEKLKEFKETLRDDIRAIDNILILDTEILNIFKANNISMEDISRLLNIKSFPSCSSMYGYWDDGGEVSVDAVSLNYLLKVLSMSKNDLAYIISKCRILRQIFNLEGCYFSNLLVKLENSKYSSRGNKVIESNKASVEAKKDSTETDDKADKAINILSQVLNMVNKDIELTFNDFDVLFNNEQQKIKELFSFASGESICIDATKLTMLNDSGALIVYSNNTLREVIAGDSEIAIKLYEDLLVGYNKNKKTAVCYSSLFTKYIIS